MTVKTKQTHLKIRRSHSESGSISGNYGKKKVDFSWNSHELWINGRCNPEDHPFEDIARDIFERCEKVLLERYKFDENVIEYEIPFEAELVGEEIIAIQLLVEVNLKQLAVWDQPTVVGVPLAKLLG